MMKKYLISGLIGILAMAMGCNSNNSLSKEEQVALKTLGADITQRTAQSLQKALKGAIDSNGIIGAIDYCNLHAVEITQQATEQENHTIKRTALKLRNPNNKPGVRDKMVLKLFEEASGRGEKIGATLDLHETGEVFYYEPIMMKPLCLNCHGEPGKQINEATFNAIKANYPKDKAMGYKEGEFRGLWVVKVR
jgi:hypothetical protein